MTDYIWFKLALSLHLMFHQGRLVHGGAKKDRNFIAVKLKFHQGCHAQVGFSNDLRRL